MPREFNLEIDPEINEVFDEGSGNSFLALRKIRWSEGSPFKLDIRRWYVNGAGDETAGKGISFITESGPGNLAESLLRLGHCDTRTVIDSIRNRDDFIETINDMLEVKEDGSLGVSEECLAYFKKPKKSSDDDATYFDPKNIFL